MLVPVSLLGLIEKKMGGPYLLLHLGANIALFGSCILFITRTPGHNPLMLSLWVFLLTMGAFYKFAIKLIYDFDDIRNNFRKFSKISGNGYLILFLLSLVLMYAEMLKKVK